MRGYVAMARGSARILLAYRMNFVLATFGVLLQLAVTLAIWHAILQSGRHPGGYTWTQMKGYLLVGFGTGSLVSAFSDIRMAMRIQRGEVALDLVRPIDYQRARFAESVGNMVLEALVAAVVCAIVILATGPAYLPNLTQAALAAFSIALVVPIKFSIIYASTLLCFWTEGYLGITWARNAVANLFSGSLVPLSFFPGWFRHLAMALPFAGTTYTPALLYLGRAQGGAALRLLAIQVAWGVALWFGSRLAWRVAVRHVTIQGG
jgi:viologen exporter family transport system permease protein